MPRAGLLPLSLVVEKELNRLRGKLLRLRQPPLSRRLGAPRTPRRPGPPRGRTGLVAVVPMHRPGLWRVKHDMTPVKKADACGIPRAAGAFPRLQRARYPQPTPILHSTAVGGRGRQARA